MKKYDKGLERIGHLKEWNSMVSGQYKINVVKDEQTDNAIQLTWLIILQAQPTTKVGKPE